MRKRSYLSLSTGIPKVLQRAEYLWNKKKGVKEKKRRGEGDKEKTEK